jgi:hypothetical protein
MGSTHGRLILILVVASAELLFIIERIVLVLNEIVNRNMITQGSALFLFTCGTVHRTYTNGKQKNYLS